MLITQDCEFVNILSQVKVRSVSKTFSLYEGFYVIQLPILSTLYSDLGPYVEGWLSLQLEFFFKQILKLFLMETAKNSICLLSPHI